MKITGFSKGRLFIVSMLAFSDNEATDLHPFVAFKHKPTLTFAESFDEAIEEVKEELFKHFPISERWCDHSLVLISSTDRILEMALKVKENRGFVETEEAFEVRTVKFDADGLIKDDSIKELSSIA